MSNPTFPCFRCGIDVSRPNAACRDCHTTDPAYCKTPPPTLKPMHHHFGAKLDASAVGHIKALLNRGISCAAIARQHGVIPNTISAIKTGRTWPNVEATT